MGALILDGTSKLISTQGKEQFHSEQASMKDEL